MVTADGILLLYPNGINRTHGNDVVLRNTSVDIDFAFTSWINRISALAAGILKNFYLFVERRNTGPSLKRLQIWRAVSDADYTLIWERIANFSAAHTHALYKV